MTNLGVNDGSDIVCLHVRLRSVPDASTEAIGLVRRTIEWKGVEAAAQARQESLEVDLALFVVVDCREWAAKLAEYRQEHLILQL